MKKIEFNEIDNKQLNSHGTWFWTGVFGGSAMVVGIIGTAAVLT